MGWKSKPHATPYPSANPHACSVATAAMSAPPAEAMAAEEEPMTLEHERRWRRRGWAKRRNLFTASGNHRFGANPPSMGSSTTCRVLANNPDAGTGTSVPASVFVIEASARAKRRRRGQNHGERYVGSAEVGDGLLAVPPGQHPTRMRPTATGRATGKSLPMTRPSVGMIVYCSATPSATCSVS